MNRTTIRRIVVGVDGSDAAARALEWAIGLAAPLDAEVIAVYAYEIPTYVPRPNGAPSVPEQENWERAIRQDFELRWCAPLAAAGVRHRTVFEIGHAGDVLLREAETVVADLIVTGSRGRGGLVELLGGSVSQSMVHHPHCPVVVVPPVRVARVPERAVATA
jgi:nucleotide-binding universal stress UspA family protein